MEKSEIQEYARKLFTTLDAKYNLGRRDIMNWNFHTDAAKYFLECEFMANEKIKD